MGAIAAERTHEELYRVKATKPEIVMVPPARFLMVDGRSLPGDTAFQEAIGALYAIAYTAKFSLKKEGVMLPKVPPLEGLYDLPEHDLPEPGGVQRGQVRQPLRWTLMLRIPDELSDEHVDRFRVQVIEKKGLVGAERVHAELFEEGLSVQLLHVGPYSEETPTIARMIEFAAEQGYTPQGRHHEIYLGDPRRAKPERLKTILRQPLR